MRTELYQWMKSLAFFHVLTTALLHILPDKRYEQYIRLFMGLRIQFKAATNNLSWRIVYGDSEVGEWTQINSTPPSEV